MPWPGLCWFDRVCLFYAEVLVGKVYWQVGARLVSATD